MRSKITNKLRAVFTWLSTKTHAHLMWLRAHRATWRLLAYLVVAAAFFFTIYRIEVEGNERRDQICEQAERVHLQEVVELRRTYDYLDGLQPEQLKDPLNATVLTFLPQTEHTAQTDSAPPFCDEPGVGLPEPDPVVPKRPEKIDKLLKSVQRPN